MAAIEPSWLYVMAERAFARAAVELVVASVDGATALLRVVASVLVVPVLVGDTVGEFVVVLVTPGSVVVDETSCGACAPAADCP